MPLGLPVVLELEKDIDVVAVAADGAGAVEVGNPLRVDRHRHRSLPLGAHPDRSAVADIAGHHVVAAFTQCCGYLIATIGPVGFGVLFDVSGG